MKGKTTVSNEIKDTQVDRIQFEAAVKKLLAAMPTTKVEVSAAVKNKVRIAQEAKKRVLSR